jgi:hypothetical protein
LVRRLLTENADLKQDDIEKDLEQFHSRMTPLLLKYPDRMKIVSLYLYLDNLVNCFWTEVLLIPIHHLNYHNTSND